MVFAATEKAVGNVACRAEGAVGRRRLGRYLLTPLSRVDVPELTGNFDFRLAIKKSSCTRTERLSRSAAPLFKRARSAEKAAMLNARKLCR